MFCHLNYAFYSMRCAAPKWHITAYFPKNQIRTELIKICEQKLTSTEAEVSKIIQALSE